MGFLMVLRTTSYTSMDKENKSFEGRSYLDAQKLGLCRI